MHMVKTTTIEWDAASWWINKINILSASTGNPHKQLENFDVETFLI